jgi:hypothetical protein
MNEQPPRPKFNPSVIRQVTKSISFGPYPVDWGAALSAAGVTHVLSLAGPIHAKFESQRFRDVSAIPFEDLQPMSRELIEELLRAVFKALGSSPEAHLYVHCAAGQNRSPTTVWLALIAAGLSADDAAELIGKASFDANPGHSSLIPEPDTLIPWLRELAPKLDIPTHFINEL